MATTTTPLQSKADGEVRKLLSGGGSLEFASNLRFSINGRFLTQPLTGVQRYASETIRALDSLLTRSDVARLIAPVALETIPLYRSIACERFGPGGGHFWEQTVLPRRASGPLLNLCNTAPALRHGQIVCVHDANVFDVPDSYSPSFRLFYRLLQPWIARRADGLTTVSKNAADRLVRAFGVPAAAISVLPNGHEHALRWDASRSALFVRVPPRRAYVLLLGSQAKHKNIGRILGLADPLDDLGLDIVVAGGDASVFARTSPETAPNVRWLGRVSDDDLALLLQNAICLAFPSLAEGFGLPIIEAMAHGCPVVSSNRTSLPEVCGCAALLADPNDHAAWLKHIRTLATSSACRAELSERGYEQARRFSWAETAQGYLDLIEMGDL